MSVARHSTLVVAPGDPAAKARHGSLAINGFDTGSKAQHGSLFVHAAGQTSSARHGTLTVFTSSAGPARKFIKIASGLVPLGADTSTPVFPVWGPYGEPGAYEPGETTSGCDFLPGAAPNGIWTGDRVITTANTVFEGYEVTGRVIVQAANVTVKNCWIWGGSGTAAPGANQGGIVNCQAASCVNAKIYDNTIEPSIPNQYWDGIRGWHYEAFRNRIKGTCDGLGIDNPSGNFGLATGVKVYANLIGPFGYRTSTLQADGHTHNDCIQIHNCNGIEIVGNKFLGFTDPQWSNLTNPYASTGSQVTGQCILIQPQNADEINILIQDNWFSGGGEAQVHMAPNGVRLIDNVDIYGNRYYRDSRPLAGVRHTVRRKAGTTITNIDVPLTGDNSNLYVDTLTPITVTA